MVFNVACLLKVRVLGNFFDWDSEPHAAMMMRLLQAESAAGLNLFFTPLSCHRVGCGLQGTVSRKSSSSPFYFKAKQRKNTPHSRRVENSSSQSNGKKWGFVSSRRESVWLAPLFWWEKVFSWFSKLLFLFNNFIESLSRTWKKRKMPKTVRLKSTFMLLCQKLLCLFCLFFSTRF